MTLRIQDNVILQSHFFTLSHDNYVRNGGTCFLISLQSGCLHSELVYLQIRRTGNYKTQFREIQEIEKSTFDMIRFKYNSIEILYPKKP